MQLAAAKEALSSTGSDPLRIIDRAIELVNRGLVETRRCVHDLRYPAVEEPVLSAALRHLAERWDVDGRWRCQFQSKRIPEKKLSSRVKYQLLRVAQEAIHNAAGHANPTLILLTLRWRTPNVLLQIIDNGKGIFADRLQKCEGFGLQNMRKRAEDIDARFEIRTAPDRGTTITLTVPIS